MCLRTEYIQIDKVTNMCMRMHKLFNAAYCYFLRYHPLQNLILNPQRPTIITESTGSPYAA